MRFLAGVLLFVPVVYVQAASKLESRAIELRDAIYEMQRQGSYSEALPAVKRLIPTLEQMYGSDHISVTNTLLLLADLYMQIGDRENYARYLTLAEDGLPKGTSVHPGVNQLTIQGKIYFDMGDMRSTFQTFQRALSLLEASGDNYTLQRSVVKGELGRVYEELHDYEKAETHYKVALQLARAVRPVNANQLGTVLNNLGNLYFKRRRLAEAKETLAEGLQAYAEASIETASIVGPTMVNLGNVLQAQGDAAGGLEIYLEAKALYEQEYGNNNPSLIHIYNNLGAGAWRQGDGAAATRWHRKALEVQESTVFRNILVGTETQKLNYLKQFDDSMGALVSLSLELASDLPESSNVALDSVLQRKSRVLEVMATSLAGMHRELNENDQLLLDEYARLKTAALNDARVYSLEQYLGERSKRDVERHKSVDTNQVRQHLPTNSVLLEYVAYTPMRPPEREGPFESGPARYAAFLMKGNEPVKSFDLGAASDLNQRVERFRESLTHRRSLSYKREGNRLFVDLVLPLLAEIPEGAHVFVAPDRQLNFVPFSALVDYDEEFLLNRNTFSYLPSGRYLVSDAGAEPGGRPVIVADPEYGPLITGADQECLPDDDRSNPDLPGQFRRLCGTLEEATSINQLLPNARLLLRENATKANVLALKSPSVLHIATHGYYLSSERGANDRSGAGDALSRSGLALAHANQPTNQDSGFLSAAELVLVDLSNTQIAVLSACETGLGDVVNGDGVYGLRRALVLAGARTQLISLWKVSDSATRRLMTDFYARLLETKNPFGALAEAKRAYVRDVSPLERHPYYWASFVASGQWGLVSL